jgi:two-component system phosphate regulon response regulator PhoB
MVDATDTGPVLIVDDERDICRLIEFNLREVGFTCETAHTGTDAVAKATALVPAIVVLDLMLPDLPGTEVCRRLRADPALSEVAILILTARGDEYDRLVGFELGADDYVVKPFSVREVVLRVRALARRCSERSAARRSTEVARQLSWRGLTLDAAGHRAYSDGVELTLRPMEFKLISVFLENPNHVFTRDRLLDEVWGISTEVNTRTIDTHIRRLRLQLGNYGDVIETVRGVGYRLREP